MGQPVTVIEKPSSTPGVLRFEINRTLTGMGHEWYRSLEEITGDQPADVLARRIFERGGVSSVHVYSNMVTVKLADASPPAGLKEIVEELYLYYKDGVVPTLPEGVAAE